ncbi:MAG: hypothetical protein AAF125_19325, partial [Chloroflexota bacterium]
VVVAMEEDLGLLADDVLIELGLDADIYAIGLSDASLPRFNGEAAWSAAAAVDPWLSGRRGVETAASVYLGEEVGYSLLSPLVFTRSFIDSNDLSTLVQIRRQVPAFSGSID